MTNESGGATMVCPECKADLQVPDDPRLSKMIDTLNSMQQALDKLAAAYERDTGKKPKVPNIPAPEGVTKRKTYDGFLFDVEEDETAEDE